MTRVESQYAPQTETLAQTALPPSSNQSPLLAVVWFRGDRPRDDAQNVVEEMLRHACGPYGLTATTGGDARLAWGLIVPEKFAPVTCWSIYIRGSELCVVEGDFYDDPPGLKLVPGDNPELAYSVASQMRKDPNRGLTELNGIYSGIYVNPDRSCAYVFGDMTGTRAVFWLSEPHRLVVTGNLWAFRGCTGFERSWDRITLMQMLTLGFPLAGRTWIEGVRQLQRGRQVRSFANGRTDVRMLLKPIPRQSWSLARSIRGLRECMDETVGRICRRLDRPVGLGLSGGLDSRLFLASLHTQALPHRSFTFCLDREEPDIQIARLAAGLLGEPHTPIMLDVALAGTLQHDLRLINEGESPGFAYLLLAAHAQQDTNTLMIGYPGDVYAGATSGPFRPLYLKRKLDLAKYMLRSCMVQFTASQASKVLAPPFRVPWQEVLDEWFESFDRIEQESIMDVYLDHMTDYRLQRRTRPRIESLRWFCLPIYPYMDTRLYTAYRSLPLSYLSAERAHLALLCDYKTGLENLPAAARIFARMPIYKEYRYRHLIHFGRVIRQRVLVPARGRWQESKGFLGVGKDPLNPLKRAELGRLEHSQLFAWGEVQNIIERARRGVFVNRNAINRLINASIIDDFLFGGGLSAERALQYLEPFREIRFARRVA